MKYISLRYIPKVPLAFIKAPLAFVKAPLRLVKVPDAGARGQTQSGPRLMER